MKQILRIELGERVEEKEEQGLELKKRDGGGQRFEWTGTRLPSEF